MTYNQVTKEELYNFIIQSDKPVVVVEPTCDYDEHFNEQLF